jgi:F-type H+-transporting ATPase subunit epsilon
MPAAKLKVKVIDPNSLIFEGEADYVLAPGPFGSLGLMPGHTAMFAELTKGEVYVKGEQEKLVAIESGIVKIKNDEATLLITQE